MSRRLQTAACGSFRLAWPEESGRLRLETLFCLGRHTARPLLEVLTGLASWDVVNRTTPEGLAGPDIGESDP